MQTKEIYSKIVGFLKKWLKAEFVVIADVYLKALHERSHLCYTEEGDSVLIYQLHDVIQDTIDNPTDIRDDENKTEMLPHSIKVLSETVDSE